MGLGCRQCHLKASDSPTTGFAWAWHPLLLALSAGLGLSSGRGGRMGTGVCAARVPCSRAHFPTSLRGPCWWWTWALPSHRLVTGPSTVVSNFFLAVQFGIHRPFLVKKMQSQMVLISTIRILPYKLKKLVCLGLKR